MKVLLILSGYNARTTPPAERQRAESGEALRSYLVRDELDATLVDYATVTGRRGWRGWLYRLLPLPWATAVEAFARRSEADVVVTWSEQATVGLAFLLWISRAQTPHVALMYWLSKPLIHWPLRFFSRKITRLVTWSSVQARYAQEVLGFAKSHVAFIRHYVDERFWQPRPQLDQPTRRQVCAVGSEMRDYQTLTEAMALIDVPCHIATKQIRLKAGQHGKAPTLEEISASLPAHVTLAPLGLAELRQLYAASRLVIVPILPSDTDNGVTVILEAMAMGKVVVCSRTVGQVDVIEDEVTGFYVPPQDPKALAAMIVRLIDDLPTLQRVGAQARAYVAAYHRLDQFAAGVKAAAEHAYHSQRPR